MAFRKKQPLQAFLKVGIYGPAGSGKTFTSLLCAEGLVEGTGKRIAFIDTERGGDFYAMDVKERKAHPKAFDFDTIETRSITESTAELKAIDPKQHGVVIVDSVSHLWDSTVAAHQGEGEIPPWAWSTIKKPYRDFMQLLVSLPLHVFICGREGNRYEGDSMVGKKMRGEAESDYEPHIMLRLSPEQNEDGLIYRAVVEKDRSGILSGRTLLNPNFKSICKPILPLLGSEQATIQSEESVSAIDASNLARLAEEKAQISATQRDEFRGRFLLAKDMAELDKISKELTPAIKAVMTKADLEVLRKAYLNKCDILKQAGV